MNKMQNTKLPGTLIIVIMMMIIIMIKIMVTITVTLILSLTYISYASMLTPTWVYNVPLKKITMSLLQSLKH